MDVRVANVYNTYNVYNATNALGAKKNDLAGKSGGARDRFSLSTQAEDYQIARKALAGVPDIRSDKVSHFKAMIEDGTYEINPEAIAAKLIGKLDE